MMICLSYLKYTYFLLTPTLKRTLKVILLGLLIFEPYKDHSHSKVLCVKILHVSDLTCISEPRDQ